MASYFNSTQNKNWIHTEQSLEHKKQNRLKEVFKNLSNQKVKIPTSICILFS